MPGGRPDPPPADALSLPRRSPRGASRRPLPLIRGVSRQRSAGRHRTVPRSATIRAALPVA
eukprot:5203984-Prymnesium_polylepis.1